MSEFNLGFAFGSLIVGILVTPFLMYFGMVYFNFRRMEKQIIKEQPKEIIPEPNPEVVSTVNEAEKILREHRNVLQS